LHGSGLFFLLVFFLFFRTEFKVGKNCARLAK